jgi:hypothetical protein
MNITAILQRLLTVAMVFGLLLAGLFSVARPWFRTWGATQAEAEGALPGDEIVPNADRRAGTTRALTIAAPVSAVWPWLAQLGQDRGGFYSFELLEDLVGCEMPGAERVYPEHQSWKPGDKLWMYPPSKLHGLGSAPLARYEEGRVLAFATRRIGSQDPSAFDGSWSFVLQPIDAATTRLLVRGRAAGGRGMLGTAFDRLVFDSVHFVMERKTMEGIKLRAEGGHGSKDADTVQVALWTLTFALFLVAGVLAVKREQWLRPLAAFATAGIVFQLLTFLQPPVVVGAALVLAAAAVLWLRLPQRGARRIDAPDAAPPAGRPYM